jgi:hypothetical protein
MPSFATPSPFDYDLKKAVMIDTLKILCMTPERREFLKRERKLMYEKRLT